MFLAMPNPLDEAFAEAAAQRSAKEQRAQESRVLREQAEREWVGSYREVLEAVPRHIHDAPETITLGWDRSDGAPSAITDEGDLRCKVGRLESVAFGTCSAWSFRYGPWEEKSSSTLYVSADCTSIFKAHDFRTGRTWSLLRAKSVSFLSLGPFADIATGGHHLGLQGYASQGTYKVQHASLPDAKELSRIIAGLEPK